MSIPTSISQYVSQVSDVLNKNLSDRETLEQIFSIPTATINNEQILSPPIKQFVDQMRNISRSYHIHDDNQTGIWPQMVVQTIRSNMNNIQSHLTIAPSTPLSRQFNKLYPDVQPSLCQIMQVVAISQDINSYKLMKLLDDATAITELKIMCNSSVRLNGATYLALFYYLNINHEFKQWLIDHDQFNISPLYVIDISYGNRMSLKCVSQLIIQPIDIIEHLILTEYNILSTLHSRYSQDMDSMCMMTVVFLMHAKSVVPCNNDYQLFIDISQHMLGLPFSTGSIQHDFVRRYCDHPWMMECVKYVNNPVLNGLYAKYML